MALVAGNVLAVAIAAFYPPITMSIMFLYWAECVVVGAFNVAKMQYVPGHDRADRIGVAVLFLVHYGGLTFMCFGVLHQLARFELRQRGMPQFDFGAYYAGFIWVVLILAAGHAVSFVRNFLGRREYESRSLDQQMWRPYRRVVLMIGIVFAACCLVIVTQLPTAAALLFVPFKLWADLRAHFREHSAPEPVDERSPNPRR
jgi:hypothetical protein